MFTLRRLFEQLASKAYNDSLLGKPPIIGDLSEDMSADEIAKKLDIYFHDYIYQIRVQADEIMYHESSDSREFVVANAEECLQMLDIETLLTEGHKDAWALASEKVEAYLYMQKHLSDKEEMLLKTYLPPIVGAAVLQLQLLLLEQAEFRDQIIGKDHEKIADLKNRLQSVEAYGNYLANPAYRVADITMQLKGLWNDYPFLERSRKDGQQKELREFYKLPYGKYKVDDVNRVDIGELIQETIDSGDDRHKRMLVLLGAPGSGKTTVITYLLNELKIDRPARVYSLAEFVNINPVCWPDEMLDRMGLVQKDLDNSILILDGLDEMDLYGQYEVFVEKLRMAWANNDEITNFTLILTCRSNRINPDLLQCIHVTLVPLTVSQIMQIASDYRNDYPLNLEAYFQWNADFYEVFGIPLLLYLVLGLGLDTSPDTTIASLYDTIFSLDGDKCIYKRSYDHYKHPVTAALAEKIHSFSQNVAVEMFSKEDIQEELEKASYIPLAQKVIGSDLVCNPEDLLIGQYFLLGRKEQKIYFAHRSIFEYFVALSVFNALVRLAESCKNPEQLYREMMPGAHCTLTPVAELLCLHPFSEFPGIEKFIHYLIHTHIDQLEVFHDWADLMKLYYTFGLTDAICYHPHGGRQGVQEENNQLFNLLDICRTILIVSAGEKIDLLPALYHNSKTKGTDDSSSGIYFPVKDLRKKNMSNLDLTGCNFSYVVVSDAVFSYSACSYSNWTRSNGDQTNFEEADLSFADLSHASFARSLFTNVNFTGANLAYADFSFSDLSGAVFFDTDVTGTDFTGAIVSNTDFGNTDLSKANFLSVDFTKARALSKDNLSYNQSEKNKSKDVILQKNNFEYFDLTNRNFSYSQWSENNMHGADFSDSKLCFADLSGADLSWAKFMRTDLSHANLKDANLKNAILDECTFNQCILPDGRLYEDAVEQDGSDVILQFTDG